jgi:hypothetical protein
MEFLHMIIWAKWFDGRKEGGSGLNIFLGIPLGIQKLFGFERLTETSVAVGGLRDKVGHDHWNAVLLEMSFDGGDDQRSFGECPPCNELW